MLYREFVVFLSSRRNIVSLCLTLLFITTCYGIFLQMASDEQRIKVFFESFYVNVPTLVFYLIYFKTILQNGSLRFFAINLIPTVFRLLLYFKIIVVWLVCTFSVGTLYFIFYLPLSNISNSTAILKFLYFSYFQLFECSLCFVLMSLFKSTWTIFGVIFYAMSENTVMIILKSKGFELAQHTFPFQSFKNIIEGNNSIFNIVSLLYLSLLFWAIYNLNYKKL